MKEAIDINQIKAEIFDARLFSQSLQADSSLIATYRNTLDAAQAKLDQYFMQDAPIRHLVNARAWLIDQILEHAWNQMTWQRKPHISLIAVGGYGRGELHPHSDIDLLILYKGSNIKTHHENIEQFLTFLWDIGLKVGQSVRSIKECKEQAKQDITVATSLMESRTIAGNSDLLKAMFKKVALDKIWPSHTFFEAKREEQISRHQKFNDIEYNLEPNVKGSPGGLRDIQMISWVAKRHFGGDNLKTLVSNHFLTAAEFDLLNAGQDFLWKVRYGLHMLAGRAEDRLLFDHQKSLAGIFGFEDNIESLAIEQLMQKVYRIVLRNLVLNDMILQHFDETILHAKEKPKVKPLNARFKITNDYIEVVDKKVFERSPFALMEIFLLLAKNPEIQGIRASTIRLFRECRDLIDDDFRQDIQNITIFMEILRSPNGVVTQLHRMRRYGILGRYLPEFGRIIGKMQYDLFHIYTVDAHTLFLLQYLRRIYIDSETETLPLANKVIHQVPKVELLYIAALYHDIAKGRGGDHSELGAADAHAFCVRHNLNEWEADLVSWLVRNHLIMSMTSQRKDISDPAIVQAFAEHIGDQLHLDYLFLLTVADINATNPKLWNSWRASLMSQLYLETKRALSRGLENPIDKQNAIYKNQQDALLYLPYNPIIANQLWMQLGDDYFIQHSAEDIAWHTQAILEHTEPDKPLVLIKEIGEGQRVGGTQIFIYSQTDEHLFAVTADELEQLNLNILDARISTSPTNFNLNSYIVLEENGLPIGNNQTRIDQIQQGLIRALTTPHTGIATSRRHTPRRLQHFTMPTEVNIFNDEILSQSVVEVISPDRSGLLARIGRIFLEHDVILQKAKIATLGERVEDVFFITNKNLQPIVEEELRIALKLDICRQLDDSIQPKSNQPTQMAV
jgi:[protein-PII] uridylyltransferase